MILLPGWAVAQEADIARFYQDEKAVPPFAQAVQDLAQDQDPAKRDAAGHYLTALCDRLLADEQAGRSPVRATAFWGRSPEGVARQLRAQVAAAVGKDARGDAALEVARWLLDKELAPESAQAGLQVVERTPGPRADEALRAVLTRPHPMAKILVGAIKEAAKRHLSVEAEIGRLCGSPRTSVREAARAVATGPVPPLQPVEGFTPELEKQLRDFAAMVLDEIPPAARWMRFHAVVAGEAGYRQDIDFSGWQVEETPDTRRTFVDYFARRFVLDEHDPAKPTLGVAGQSIWGGADAGMPLERGSVTVTPATFAEDAQRFQAIRNLPVKSDEARKGRGVLSVRGGLTAQFEPGFIALPEVLVAAWAFGHGETAVAADILFPRLDATDDDRWLPQAARDYLGNHYHQAMLQAFSARDYDGTNRLARHLARPIFDGYRYQERAKELAAQIARRGDDFKTFTLPTPADWGKIRAGLDRAAQVRYLAERLRLLNCFQSGQPGGVNYGDRQYAEATPFAARKTAVKIVNPYRELQAMRLTPDELTALVPFLTDADFLPTFSFWRDFQPDWHLHYVGMVVAPLINAAAHHALVDLRKFGALDEGERRAYLDGILEWCRANHDKTAEAMMLETIRSARDWTELQPESSLAARTKSAAALPVLAARLKDFDQYRTAAIAGDCFLIGTPGLLPIAHGWLDDKAQPEGVRFWAALSLVRDGSEAERREGLDALKPLLERKEGSSYRERARDTLLDSRDETAIRLVVGFLEVDAVTDWSTEATVRELFMRGRQEALDYIVRKLDSEQNAGSTSVARNGKGVTEPITEADRIGDWTSRWRTDGYKFSYETSAAERRQKERELVDWFKTQFERIKTGQKADLREFEKAGADEDADEEGL